MSPSRRMILALLALLYAMGFAEGYLRLFGSRQFGDHGRSYVHRPWQERIILGVPFRTNGWGLRGGAFTPRVLRIVAFGGSATEALDLPVAQTWPAALERHLNDRFGARMGQAANAGSSGLSSAHYVAHLGELSAPLGLDVAVIYTGINDADRLAREGRIQRVERIGDRTYREAFVQAFIAPDAARLTGAGDSLLERSYVALFLRSFVEKSLVQPVLTRIENRIPGRRLRDKRARLRASPDFGAVLARARTDYAHNLGLMLEAARAAGVTPIFVTAPPIDGEPELVALNEALVSFCQERGVPLVDVAARTTPPGGWYARGTHHFTREISDEVGAWIAGAIADLLEGRRPGGDALRRRARERGLTLSEGDDVRWPEGVRPPPG